ncbi:MAG: hypothetical protein K0B81_06705 [Candidatus Cloacimonetes bacterium]|nr:hypothetical protein [Candidatus Cloacimonadota bacterium]
MQINPSGATIFHLQRFYAYLTVSVLIDILKYPMPPISKSLLHYGIPPRSGIISSLIHDMMRRPFPDTVKQIQLMSYTGLKNLNLLLLLSMCFLHSLQQMVIKFCKVFPNILKPLTDNRGKDFLVAASELDVVNGSKYITLSTIAWLLY